MADEQTGAGASELPVATAGGSGALSPEEAARSLSDWRNKRNAAAAAPSPEKPNSQPERSAPATAANESAEEADATSPEQEPNRETEATDLEESPPLIDPPPSWTHEQRERWLKLDPETQQYLVDYDRKTSTAVSRAQKEAAEQLKGLSAREQAMEQARLQFEQATQIALQAAQQQLQGEFGDIQTMEDVKRLANEDWARYLRWDAHQKDISAKMTAVREANERQAQETQTKFARFAQDEDKRFIERAPEFADADKAAKLQNAAIATLKSVGFTEEELAKHWNGQDKLSLRDHRVQLLIADGVRYRQAQETAKKTAARALPPVQRPGMAPGKPDLNREIRNQTVNLDNAKGLSAIEAAVALQRLKRQAGGSR